MPKVRCSVEHNDIICTPSHTIVQINWSKVVDRFSQMRDIGFVWYVCSELWNDPPNATKARLSSYSQESLECTAFWRGPKTFQKSDTHDLHRPYTSLLQLSSMHSLVFCGTIVLLYIYSKSMQIIYLKITATVVTYYRLHWLIQWMKWLKMVTVHPDHSTTWIYLDVALCNVDRVGYF